MGKLTKKQIEEYFTKHLPYRNRILTVHKKICDRGPYNGDPAILQACFEASLITGRMYLNVLGISKTSRQLSKNHNYQSDDVNAEDLGGRLVDIDTLSPDEKDLLFDFLIMADKGAAHLTLPREHGLERTHEAIEKY
ncbi:MAG: hypothetical protein JW837_19030 [Sedimentisphaerales bacterium]|nr:hypothetical protein [Sedimentisphaerales bacterium]